MIYVICQPFFFPLPCSLDPWFTACVVPLEGDGGAARLAAELELGTGEWEAGNGMGTDVDDGDGG